MEDVCLVGFGAIGAIYAYALDRSSKVRVTAVCRSNYSTISENGLEIISDKVGRCSSWKPYRVVRAVEEAADRTYSFIICAMKCVPEILSTPTILGPILSKLTPDSETAFVLLQNGIGIEDDLQTYLNKKGLKTPILSGCCWIDTTAVNGGKTVTQYGTERLALGYHVPSVHEDSSNFSENLAKQKLDSLCNMLHSGGVTPEPVDDIDAARWRKVLWNASFSTICTLSRSTVGDVLAVPSAKLAIAQVMAEVLSVARATLPEKAAATLPDTVIKQIIDHENPGSTFKPSMLVDLEHGRPMEVEAIVGGVLKRASAVAVPTPRLDLIYAGLSVIQKGLLEHRQ
ncbi:ketopantoate reductase PanE/ApbA C terminal-domain-containing protein [Abortiporus biennis]|nr:ketopantoate reductase PanE/ApbA C terminal-domain-containing protein [Abortiporus biennis]